MTALTPGRQRLSAEFEASLRGGEAYMEQWTFSVDWRIKTAEYDRSALDPTTPAGQIAAMELLAMQITPKASTEWIRTKGQTLQLWQVEIVGMNIVTDWLSPLPDAICAAWLAAAERWKATATPSDAAG